MAWLLAASLFFYAYWNVVHLPLLVGSIAGNFLLGRWLARTRSNALLALGVALNLGLLGYFKYLGFFANTFAALLGGPSPALTVILPLAISFFTFQQIAYLVDVHSGHDPAADFVSYALFVTFFPHLIAGPILHHADIIPQFQRPTVFRIVPANLATGLAIFGIGLYKKVVLADGIAQYANPVFDSALAAPPEFFAAWSGALAYTFQLYFDFSGYSDMAIGLARLFGVRLPLNFDSPYKAANIVEFWRRWHMTLSRFLRDYLYIPLGGNRKGPARRYGNLFVVMLLGGLWHGAGWTFIAWGALHGAYLAMNHFWWALRRRLGFGEGPSGPLGLWAGRTFTFLAVVVGWVLFRARDFETARVILAGMAGGNGVVLPDSLTSSLSWLPAASLGIRFGYSATLAGDAFFWLALMLAIVWFAPNTQQILAHREPAFGLPASATRALLPAPARPAYGMLLGLGAASLIVVAVLIVVARGGQTGEFIYMIF
jgi:D-alanyl-lipoteichoic acid acyltransferase DltB (MBOAT superfamily)